MPLVVFLKGINVGGHRRLRPRDIAARLKRFGVINVGASGTFVVRKRVVRRRLTAEISRLLPFKSYVSICDSHELSNLVRSDPFQGIPKNRKVIQFVSILSRVPRRQPELPLSIPANGRWLVRVLGRKGRLVYGLHRRELKVIGHLERLETIFGGHTTTRGWGTVRSVLRRL